MIFPSEHILVLGHKNPDTDACTSAQGYANLLNQIGIYDSPVSAGIVGDATPQSRHVFDTAGISLPPLVGDLWPRVRDVATLNPRSLSTDDRLRTAIELLIQSGYSMLPVLEADNKLHSVFSHRRDISRFLLELDVLPLLSTFMTWDDIASLPGMSPIGSTLENSPIQGQLIVALDGQDSWRQEVGPDDLLACGALSVARALPEGRTPRGVVLIDTGSPPEADLTAINEQGSYVLQYRHGIGDLFAALKLQIRLGTLDLGTGPCVGELDRLQDAAGIVRASRCAVPVIDSESSVTGIISRSDLSAPPRRRVVLVDHFEAAQTAAGIEHAEILEILDHHRIGDIETPSPARVDCRPVGSTCTIVALRYQEEEVPLDVSTATLLLGGITADTLCLTGPTTTNIDKRVARDLERIVGTSVQEFGRRVLEAGDDLLTAEPSEIWSRDQKVFSIRNRTFSVAQLETVSLESIPRERLLEFRNCLENDFEQTDHIANMLFITDVLTGDSWLTHVESSDAEGVVAPCFGREEPSPGWILAEKVVSRKKQIVPRLMKAFAELP